MSLQVPQLPCLCSCGNGGASQTRSEGTTEEGPMTHTSFPSFLVPEFTFFWVHKEGCASSWEESAAISPLPWDYFCINATPRTPSGLLLLYETGKQEPCSSHCICLEFTQRTKSNFLMITNTLRIQKLNRKYIIQQLRNIGMVWWKGKTFSLICNLPALKYKYIVR